MDASNLMPGQGASGVWVNAPMQFGDWRVELQADSRQRIVGKIMAALRRHLALDEYEIREMAMTFEEKIYAVATSQTLWNLNSFKKIGLQSDYLRKISLKMLTMEMRPQNLMPDPGADHKDGVVIDPPQENPTGSNQKTECCKCGNQAH
ncbi:coactivator CBP, KIX domain-containing protein [Artemisia annua]|uniref:Coactivator CBP, KIX domain-containing protein n=1 Tax=Artemisia annua TaxID=35608 RepID=A0A2U1MYZ2_ARTAN|nr:coactivator CBP, KIX domain-containing protein [Artemisia annua]